MCCCVLTHDASTVATLRWAYTRLGLRCATPAVHWCPPVCFAWLLLEVDARLLRAHVHMSRAPGTAGTCLGRVLRHMPANHASVGLLCSIVRTGGTGSSCAYCGQGGGAGASRVQAAQGVVHGRPVHAANCCGSMLVAHVCRPCHQHQPGYGAPRQVRWCMGAVLSAVAPGWHKQQTLMPSVSRPRVWSELPAVARAVRTPLCSRQRTSAFVA